MSNANTNTTTTKTDRSPELASGIWHLDPARSSVEFQVRHFYGLMTVKGHFDRFHGSLDISRRPAVELVIDSASLDTKMAKRDEHLRSAEFFDVAEHPEVRFVGETAVIDGDTLKVRGELHAAGRQVPLDVDAALREVDGEFELEATALVDHRKLGMTWSPAGIMRSPSKLIVRAHLSNKEAAQ